MADEKECPRIIFASGTFNETMTSAIIAKLITFEQMDPTKPISLYIDSYGGQLHSFLAIHDMIKLCRCDVATIVVGKAMSCGQMLLMSGTKGKRFATKNSTILMHPLSSMNAGNIHQLDNSMTESKRLQNVINGLVTDYSKITKKELTELMSKDSYLTADQALKLGIIDHIITKPSDLAKYLHK